MPFRATLIPEQNKGIDRVFRPDSQSGTDSASDRWLFWFACFTKGHMGRAAWQPEDLTQTGTGNQKKARAPLCAGIGSISYGYWYSG
jgi:hypothetical protein